jgi:hypothetical protein
MKQFLKFILNLSALSAVIGRSLYNGAAQNTNDVVRRLEKESPVRINPLLKWTRESSSSSASSALSKRLSFTPGGRTDYCGESGADEDFSESAPLASDCEQIASYMDSHEGFYTISPSDFDPATGWARIVTSGTCTYAVRFLVPADTTTALMGSNDIRFYIRMVTRDAQNGRIGATGGIACYNGNTIILLGWGLIHS